MAMTLVSTVTVPSTGQTDTITWSDIPQTGKDLLLLGSGRDNNGRLFFRVNGEASNQFTVRRLLGDGSTTSSGTFTSLTVVLSRTDTTANTFGNFAITISNYTSNNSKAISVDVVTENNATGANQMLAAASTNTTSPITSLTIDQTIFSPNSSFSLYIIS